MAKTATKKGPNKKRTSALSSTNQIRPHHAATVVAKKQSPASGHASNSKTRKKKLSHQQASQARHMIDAEFRDLRAGNLPSPGAIVPMTTTTTMSTTLGPSDHRLSEHSVQDLAGILGAL